MATAEQSPTPPSAPTGTVCANCGAPLAADQRYCLSCGTRRGEPRVPVAGAPVKDAATARAKGKPAEPPTAPRSADVSPIAAVIGIALLGGMLLIGVLIGRGSGDDESAAPVIRVEEAAGATTTTTSGADGEGSQTTTPTDVASEWPQGTDGFTIQLSTVSKQDATTESVAAAKQGAVTDGAADAAVLDSDLYASLPPGNYVIYSGVFTDRKSAEVALKGLSKSFPAATVVEVSDGGESATPELDNGAIVPGAGGESEIPPETQN
jgi:hypothetical protein